MINKKESFVFGGTDLEFMIQTATIDGRLEPWLILALFIILLVLIFINIFKLIKKNKYQITSYHTNYNNSTNR